MFSIRTLAASLALGALALLPSIAEAAGPCGPYCSQPSVHPGFGSSKPVFQAAPWYLYWPYDAHFQTPAPLAGPYYAPAIPGNFPVNPYFPAPGGGYGYGAGYAAPSPYGVPQYGR